MVAAASWPGRTELVCAGSATLAGDRMMVPGSVFRIASVTKILTATVALMLVDDGCLELDEPLGAWLPELADKQAVADYYGPIGATRTCDAVTLRHLLSMTNGMGNYFAPQGQSELAEIMMQREVNRWNSPLSADELLGKIANLPLMFGPGERWLYHLGFDLAGIVIERITGQRLGEVMSARLFEPLCMSDTGFWLNEEQCSRLAEMTIKPEDVFLPYADWETDRTRPPKMDRGGGGLMSTAADLAAFGRFLLDRGLSGGRRLLSQAALDEMTRSQVSSAAMAASPFFPGFWETYHYGLGVGVAHSPDAISDTPGRFGWWGGTGTSLFMDPVREVAVVTLTQREICTADDLMNANDVIAAILATGTPE